MPRLSRLTNLSVLAAIAVVVVLGACAQAAEAPASEPTEPSPTPSPTPTPDPAAILKVAADKFDALRYFSFEMTHENGGTPTAFGLLMEDVTGQVAAPDRLAADIGARSGSFFIDVSVIAIGTQTYMTNPFTHEFEAIDEGIVSAALLDPATGIGGIMRGVETPTLEAEPVEDGVPMYHITSTLDSGLLKAITPSAEPGLPIHVGIWIGVNDSNVYRIRLEGPVSSEEAPEIIRTISMSDFDVPVDIEEPELAGTGS